MTHNENVEDKKDEDEDVLVEEENVIYKKDKPLLTLVRNLVISILVAVSLLFFVGMAMGFLGVRPPSLDSQVLEDQWNKVTKGETSEKEWNELEKNE